MLLKMEHSFYNFSVFILYFSILLSQINVIYSQNPCTTPQGKSGTCIPLPQCTPLAELMRAMPLRREDIQLVRRSHCGYEAGTSKVCCPLVRENRFGSDFSLPNKDVCGGHFIEKIHGGEVTDLDEFPWTALLSYTNQPDTEFRCGGALISSRYVLTAANCIPGTYRDDGWVLNNVRLGEWNTSSTRDCSGEYCSDSPVDISVEEIIVHEQYEPRITGRKNDIALLRLSQDVTYSEWIKPICLPQTVSSSLSTKSYIGEELYFVGWGTNELGTTSDVKLKVRLPVKPISECASRYREYKVVQTGEQLCAGGEKGRDSCKGDAGSPFMSLESVGESSNWVLVGLSSTGNLNCGTQGFPSIYTNVPHYYNWIKRNMKN